MYTFNIRWNYFATSHGKGPNDALGGTAKRMVHERIMARRENANVASSKTFVEVLGSPGFSVTHVSSEEIVQICNALGCTELWESSAIIQGMQNIHYVEPTAESNVLTKFYTSSVTARTQIVDKKRPKKTSKTPTSTKGKRNKRKHVKADESKDPCMEIPKILFTMTIGTNVVNAWSCFMSRMLKLMVLLIMLCSYAMHVVNMWSRDAIYL